MQFNRRFDEQFRKLLVEMGEGDGMAFRTESIEVVEQSVKALGLDSFVSDYLATTFDAEGLSDLSDEDLAQAFRFIARIEKRAAPRSMVPLRANGEMLVIRGDFCWE